MKSDSLKNNQHPEADSVVPKKSWVKLQGSPLFFVKIITRAEFPL